MNTDYLGFPRISPTAMEAAMGDESVRAVRDAYQSQRDFLYPLQSEWYLEILFVHGFQNVNFNLNTGVPVFVGSIAGNKTTPAINLTLQAVEGMKSYILQQSPKRQTAPTTDDINDLESARLGKDVMEWAYEDLSIADVEAESADWFLKTGNVVHYVYWDHTEQKLKIESDSPFRWAWDPRASSYKRAKWACRRTFQPIQWLYDHYPDKAHLVSDRMTFQGSDENFYEFALLNLTPLHAGGMQTTRGLPEGQGFVEIFEYFEVPSEEYPQGRIIICAGQNGNPTILLAEAPNIYGRIPAVHGKLISVPGRMWGEGYVKHMRPLQLEINRRQRQIRSICNLVSNPILAVQDMDSADQNISNEVGTIYKYAQNSPGYINPPTVPAQVFENLNWSVEMLSRVQPAGVSAMEDAKEANSAVQISAMEDVRRRLNAPIARAWVQLWDSTWKMYIDFFRMLVHDPVQIQAAGSESVVRGQLVSGWMMTKNFVVKVVPYNETPTTRTAAFAEVMEMLKVGMINPMDPMQMQTAWSDVGRADIAASYGNVTADIEGANRNILRAKAGEMVVPAIYDNLQVHVTRYLAYMKTPDFFLLERTNPPIAQNIHAMLQSYVQTLDLGLQRQAQAMAAQQAAMNPDSGKSGVSGGGNPKVGDPSGGAEPKMTQGYGVAMNPGANNGGPNGSNADAGEA